MMNSFNIGFSARWYLGPHRPPKLNLYLSILLLSGHGAFTFFLGNNLECKGYYVFIFCPTVVSCSQLAAPANGNIQVSATTYGGVATYSCRDGFQLSGSRTRTCQADGNWSGAQPSCIGRCCHFWEMATSWHGNAFRVTDPLRGESSD